MMLLRLNRALPKRRSVWKRSEAFYVLVSDQKNSEGVRGE
jgi:hypothetical protein